MGLIREVQEVSYHLSRAEEQKRKREELKKKNESFKRDLKNILRANIQQALLKYDNDILKIYYKKNDIISKTVEALKDIKEDKEIISFTSENRIKQVQKYIFDDFEIWDILQDDFKKELNFLYNEIETIQKLEEKKEIEALKDIINKKLLFYFKDWTKDGYDIQAVFKGFNDSEVKAEIIEDIKKELSFSTLNDNKILEIYQKLLNDFKRRHKDDVIIIKNKNKDGVKLALPWKILLFNKIIKTVLKGL